MRAAFTESSSDNWWGQSTLMAAWWGFEGNQ